MYHASRAILQSRHQHERQGEEDMLMPPIVLDRLDETHHGIIEMFSISLVT